MDREENCIWKQVYMQTMQHLIGAGLGKESKGDSSTSLYVNFPKARSGWGRDKVGGQVNCDSYILRVPRNKLLSRSQHSGHVWRY